LCVLQTDTASSPRRMLVGADFTHGAPAGRDFSGARVDHIDLEAARSSGISGTKTPDVLKDKNCKSLKSEQTTSHGRRNRRSPIGGRR